MATEQIRLLTVVTRANCHLCDDMIAGLRALAPASAFEVIIVDIDRDPVLRERYGERVPVLLGDGRELCHFLLDRTAVTAFLEQIR